jgi:hypothetical protein
MQCKKCGKEIPLNDGLVYCPYCGVKLKDEGTKKGILTKELKVGDRAKAFIVWMLLCGIMAVFFTLFKGLFSEMFSLEIPSLVDWIVLSLIGATGLYFTLAYVVYNHARKHNRRAVAWATAFVVFTPILAGLAYLLTWPKE